MRLRIEQVRFSLPPNRRPGSCTDFKGVECFAISSIFFTDDDDVLSGKRKALFKAPMRTLRGGGNRSHAGKSRVRYHCHDGMVHATLARLPVP